MKKEVGFEKNRNKIANTFMARIKGDSGVQRLFTKQLDTASPR